MSMASQSSKASDASFLPRGLFVWSALVIALGGIVSIFTHAPILSFWSSSSILPSQIQAQGLSSQFIDIVKARRTYYTLDATLPISEEKVTGIVEELLQAVPSAFNSQTNRVVILFGEEHNKLWETVSDVLKADTEISEQQWEITSQRMVGFRAASGTVSLSFHKLTGCMLILNRFQVLFFEDQDVVDELQHKFPKHANNFPVWAAHSDGMLQHAVWTALEAEGLGANLQHYNPLIDEKVARTWDLPDSWKLRAQLVFGGRAGQPGEKGFKALEEKLRVFGM